MNFSTRIKMKADELMNNEVDEIKKAFKRFETFSGRMPVGSIGNCLYFLKLVPTLAQIAAFVELGDPEKRGTVNFETFLSMAAQLWVSDPALRETKAWGAFLFFDKLDQGKLPLETMKKILTEYGDEPVPEKEVNMILKSFTDRKTSLIEYGYIIRAWTK